MTAPPANCGRSSIGRDGSLIAAYAQRGRTVSVWLPAEGEPAVVYSGLTRNYGRGTPFEANSTSIV